MYGNLTPFIHPVMNFPKPLKMHKCHHLIHVFTPKVIEVGRGIVAESSAITQHALQPRLVPCTDQRSRSGDSCSRQCSDMRGGPEILILWGAHCSSWGQVPPLSRTRRRRQRKTRPLAQPSEQCPPCPLQPLSDLRQLHHQLSPEVSTWS